MKSNILPSPHSHFLLLHYIYYCFHNYVILRLFCIYLFNWYKSQVWNKHHCHCREPCVYLLDSELHKLGALKLLVSALSDASELAASHCVLTLANMATYGGLCSDIIQLNVVTSLVALIGRTQWVAIDQQNQLSWVDINEHCLTVSVFTLTIHHTVNLDFKSICSTNPFLHSLLVPRTVFAELDLGQTYSA